MKRKNFNLINRIFLTLFALVVMAIAGSVMTFADDVPEQGSITVTYSTDGYAMSGAEIGLYKIADYTIQSEQELYIVDAEYEALGLNLPDSSSAEALADYIAQNKIEGEKKTTDSKGKLVFTELDLGLYLVVQLSDVEGFSHTDPFLVTLPQTSGTTKVYNVDASPKVDVEAYMDITVKKIWNDDVEHRPESVQIALMSGDKKYDTVTLSAENDWTKTWTDLPRDEKWKAVEVEVPKGYKVSYKKDGTTLIVENTATLIHTGQLRWPIPVLMCLGVLAIIGGIILGRKQSRV